MTNEWEVYDRHGFLPTVWWPDNEELHGRPFTVKRRSICVAGVPSWRAEVELKDGRKEEHLLTPRSIIGLPIGIYADQTGLFSDAELDLDNTYSFDAPFDLWKEWCETIGEGSHEIIEPISFYENDYTFDDTEGFYDFCKEHGYEPPRTSVLRHYQFTFEGSVAS